MHIRAVHSHIAEPIERLVTDVTFKRSFAAVGEPVVVELAGLGERFMTNVTGIRPNAAVYAEMAMET